MNRELYAKLVSGYGYPCVMCKGPNQPYMISNKLWANTFKENKDVCCCLPCLEKKLNRKLNKADFKGHEDTLINLGIFGFDYRIYLSLPTRKEQGLSDEQMRERVMKIDELMNERTILKK